MSRVAIACGGTGGHLFPGMAVATALRERGCDAVLLISHKAVDRQTVLNPGEFEAATLPAVGLAGRNWLAFASGFWKSLRLCRALFRERAVGAVLGMGGFTSAAPVVAARRAGLETFLHEANSIPGRANRHLARLVRGAFVYFPDAGARLSCAEVRVVGMPVRQQFQMQDAASCRMALGLNGQRPVLLVTGGSQGARGLNEAMVHCLPELAAVESELQFIHLTGSDDFAAVREAYAPLGRRALVRPFLTEMELALGAATVTVSRAGASVLAELAALRVPAILIPFPAAVDDHQQHNAQAFAAAGAARVVRQSDATAARLGGEIRRLLHDERYRQAMQAALAGWHTPTAAEQIAGILMSHLPARRVLLDTGVEIVREVT